MGGTTFPLLYALWMVHMTRYRVPVGLWFYRASVAAKKEIGAVKCVPIFIDSHVAARSMVIQVRDMGGTS